MWTFCTFLSRILTLLRLIFELCRGIHFRDPVQCFLQHFLCRVKPHPAASRDGGVGVGGWWERKRESSSSLTHTRAMSPPGCQWGSWLHMPPSTSFKACVQLEMNLWVIIVCVITALDSNKRKYKKMKTGSMGHLQTTTKSEGIYWLTLCEQQTSDSHFLWLYRWTSTWWNIEIVLSDFNFILHWITLSVQHSFLLTEARLLWTMRPDTFHLIIYY